LQLRTKAQSVLFTLLRGGGIINVKFYCRTFVDYNIVAKKWKSIVVQISENVN